VLELGCGDGRLALAYAPAAARVTAVDPDRKAIRRARSEARRRGVRNVRFLVGKAQNLPRFSQRFNVVLFSSSL
jgi:ubiquinone/menaquinone biosynthesis C-methylase UbiE